MKATDFLLFSSLMAHSIEGFVIPRKKKSTHKSKKCVARIKKEKRARKARKNQRK